MHTTMRTRRMQVADLYPGATVTGTGPSGDFSTGPRVLVSIVEAPEHSKRTTAYFLRWEDGGFNVYYGDTEVDVVTVTA